jgi:hypothetical protein
VAQLIGTQQLAAGKKLICRQAAEIGTLLALFANCE